MTRRRRLRRRLLWVGVRFGLVLLLTTVSVLRVGIWTRGQLMAAARRIRVVPLTRKENTMYARTSFVVVVAAAAALLLGAPASADRWGADRRDTETASTSDWFERAALAAGAKQPQVMTMLDAREEALVAKAAEPRVNAVDARERSFAAKQVAQPTTSSSPDWAERFAATHSIREPVVDDRFTIDPTSSPAPITVTSGSEIEWPQIGIGLGLGIALALGLLLALRMPSIRPPVAR